MQKCVRGSFEKKNNLRNKNVKNSERNKNTLKHSAIKKKTNI